MDDYTDDLSFTADEPEALLGQLDSFDDAELGQLDDESPLEELTSELGQIEDEYASDTDEMGALPRRRMAALRKRLATYRSRVKRRYATAVKKGKKNAVVAKKAIRIAKTYKAGAQKEHAIGRMTGFRGPTGTSFAELGAAGTTTTLTGRPQKDVKGGQLIIDEVVTAGAVLGASVVKEIKIGVYPLLSSNDGVALSAFQRDSTMNVFSWPEAEVGNEITVEIERSVAAGAGEDVTYSAALGPYIPPARQRRIHS